MVQRLTAGSLKGARLLRQNPQPNFHKEIVSHLDVASLCRLYAAYNDRGFKESEASIKKAIEHLL